MFKVVRLGGRFAMAGGRSRLWGGACRRSFSTHDAVQAMSDLHAVSGLPWWAFIPLTTFALRLCLTAPISVIQRRGLQKQNELRPIARAMGPVFRVKLAAAAQRAQADRAAMQKANPGAGYVPNPLAELDYHKITVLSAREKMKRQRALFAHYGVQTYKMMLLPLVQIPLWVSLSYVFRSITGWSDPSKVPLAEGGVFDASLSNEGFLYMQDLSAQDPYFVAPIVLGLAALTNAEWNFRTAQNMNWTQSREQQLGKVHRPRAFDVVMTLSRCGLMFLIAVATQAPVALVWYWICSNTFSLCQNVLLDKYLPLRYVPGGGRRLAGVSKGARALVKDSKDA